MTTDIRPHHWLVRWMPKGWWPWASLARLDRPQGTWLLLLPCWWGLALAHGGPDGAVLPFTLQDSYFMALFFAGAVFMRGAGCTINDMVDKNIDCHVARTASRPIADGVISRRAATVFCAVLCLLALGVLVQFNDAVITLCLASMVGVVAYPFAKRLTWWPQFFLGLVFNIGAPAGWLAVRGEYDVAPLLLYGAGILWTLGYDTIYALQDLEDDALLNVKSSARYMGTYSVVGIGIFYALSMVFLAVAVVMSGYAAGTVLFLLPAAIHLIWQVRTLDMHDGARCLRLFVANRDYGLLVLAGLLMPVFF